MIISASRRTDIPAFYSEWLMKRLKEVYVLIPNPRNADRLGRVKLSPENVDCIVFWKKNPMPMLDKLEQLKEKMGYDNAVSENFSAASSASLCISHALTSEFSGVNRRAFKKRFRD